MATWGTAVSCASAPINSDSPSISAFALIFAPCSSKRIAAGPHLPATTQVPEFPNTQKPLPACEAQDRGSPQRTPHLFLKSALRQSLRAPPLRLAITAGPEQRVAQQWPR